MLTRHDALTAREFHYEGDGGCRQDTGPRGGVTTHVVRARRNGMTQTWKTRPADYSVPVKYGLKQAFRITQSDAANWHASEACPLIAHLEEVS